jgi:hypothetical protein
MRVLNLNLSRTRLSQKRRVLLTRTQEKVQVLAIMLRFSWRYVLKPRKSFGHLLRYQIAAHVHLGNISKSDASSLSNALISISNFNRSILIHLRLRSVFLQFYQPLFKIESLGTERSEYCLAVDIQSDNVGNSNTLSLKVELRTDSWSLDITRLNG